MASPSCGDLLAQGAEEAVRPATLDAHAGDGADEIAGRFDLDGPEPGRPADELPVMAAGSLEENVRRLADARRHEGGLALVEQGLQALQALRVAEAWEDIDPKVMMSRLADGVRGVLTDGALSGCHIVLILDEAEALLSAQSGLADEHVLGFFRAIKGIAQETRQLSLVLVGVNAAPSEEATLAGEDNPLFGLLSPEYLGPLEAGECDEMIRRIGRRMQVRWDGPGVSRLTEKVGAHPLLARLAASDVVGSGDERLRRPTVEAVEKVFIDFHQRHTDIFEQMFYSLKRYYPSELYLLEIVASGEIGIAAELAEESPMMLNHLAGYGVLDPEHLTIAMPVLRLWLRQRQGSLGP